MIKLERKFKMAVNVPQLFLLSFHFPKKVVSFLSVTHRQVLVSGSEVVQSPVEGLVDHGTLVHEVKIFVVHVCRCVATRMTPEWHSVPLAPFGGRSLPMEEMDTMTE